jgi:hypothetical protein
MKFIVYSKSHNRFIKSAHCHTVDKSLTKVIKVKICDKNVFLCTCAQRMKSIAITSNPQKYGLYLVDTSAHHLAMSIIYYLSSSFAIV